jgi:hypothetical protein
VVDDEQTPALIVAADLRPGQVHSAAGFFAAGVVTEKQAGLGKCSKNVRIQKQVALVGINTYAKILTGVFIMD